MQMRIAALMWAMFFSMLFSATSAQAQASYVECVTACRLALSGTCNDFYDIFECVMRQNNCSHNSENARMATAALFAERNGLTCEGVPPPAQRPNRPEPGPGRGVAGRGAAVTRPAASVPAPNPALDEAIRLSTERDRELQAMVTAQGEQLTALTERIAALEARIDVLVAQATQAQQDSDTDEAEAEEAEAESDTEDASEESDEPTRRLDGRRIGGLVYGSGMFSQYYLRARPESSAPKTLSIGGGLTIALWQRLFFDFTVDLGGGLRDGRELGAQFAATYRAGVFGAVGPGDHALLSLNAIWYERYSGDLDIDEQGGRYFQLRQRGVEAGLGYIGGLEENRANFFILVGLGFVKGEHADRFLPPVIHSSHNMFEFTYSVRLGLHFAGRAP